MKPEFKHIDLIDLLSERHLELRKMLEKMWNDHSDIYISNSEWFIMAKISSSKQPTIASISKKVDITRQATHKFIKNLEAKGLVQVMDMEDNRKEKCLQLTPLGEACLEKNKAFKASLVKKISNQIGDRQVAFLYDILRLDWGLETD